MPTGSGPARRPRRTPYRRRALIPLPSHCCGQWQPFACRLPPRSSRRCCLFPDEYSTGLAAHNAGCESARWGRCGAGDRDALVAITLVATTGCTWRQLPTVFGPAGQLSTDASPSGARNGSEPGSAVVLDELGSRRKLDWWRCAVDSVSGAAKGALDRAESGRSQQIRYGNPPAPRLRPPRCEGDPLPPGPERHEFQPAGQKASVFGIFPSTR
ncbi:hypothetical protein EF914_24440 [Streptomyces sp. WAC05458]|nr:hypothetical protein EF914_24440 [Streptomyces sp. WAC05458]RSS97942.1 hypothetical protein EF919_01290 [Streptomyces sp. WAC02707]